MFPSNLLQSTTFRLGLLAIAFFVGSMSMVYTVTYFYTESALISLIQNDVLSELSELRQDSQSLGLDDVRDAIKIRADDPVGTDYYYTLIDSSGRVLTTNMPVTEPHQDWFEVQLSARPHGGVGPDPLVRARGETIVNGAWLAVGRDRSDIDALRATFIRQFLIAAGAAVVLTLACSVFVSSRILMRLGTISGAAREIIQGDLSRRVPTTGKGDEFDEVAVQLNAMLGRLARLMGRVRQVTDDIAHDLRTPLSRLRQRLEIARARARSVDEYRQAVDGAIEATDAIIVTFASLLRIAEVEAGERRAAFRTVDLSEIAEILVETYGPVAEDHGQQLRGQIMPGVLVFGDRELLGQLLANLIDNALKHAPAGGRVVLEVRQTNAGPLAQVLDNGQGIPPDRRSDVFDRFVRLDKSRTTSGSGLGLSLVAAIAELHDAMVELADTLPGQARPGLKVSIRFPEMRSSESRDQSSETRLALIENGQG